MDWHTLLENFLNRYGQNLHVGNWEDRGTYIECWINEREGYENIPLFDLITFVYSKRNINI